MEKVYIDEQRCKGCALCVNTCPKKIIEISKTVANQKGYHVAQVVDQSACISCKACAINCPDVCIEVRK